MTFGQGMALVMACACWACSGSVCFHFVFLTEVHVAYSKIHLFSVQLVSFDKRMWPCDDHHHQGAEQCCTLAPASQRSLVPVGVESEHTVLFTRLWCI